MERMRKPDWLKIKLSSAGDYAQVQQIIAQHRLHTICTAGRCPNLCDCWAHGTATLMILGDRCTRNCKFCNTLTGKPLPVDHDEPARVAASICQMRLKHAVITSVDRDDLPDLGAAHWVQTILAVKGMNPFVTIEALMPDFQGNTELIDTLIAAKPAIISHNLETVRRLTPLIRSVANYDTSLRVIEHVAKSGITAKSGLMVGFGESEKEVIEAITDLRKAGCSMLTIGQYLQPSKRNIAVTEYVAPVQFAHYKQVAMKQGFLHVESAPLVRSSYHAESQYK